jgi:hypothetical protein
MSDMIELVWAAHLERSNDSLVTPRSSYSPM